MMKNHTPTTLFALAVVGILAAAAGASWWAYTQHRVAPVHETLAAGLALPSGTQINVLKGAPEAEPGQTVTQSNQLLPSTAQVSIAPEAATPPIQQQPFNETAARLGTTLSMLLSTWGNGGPLPHQLANAAAQLARQTGNKALASAAANLRQATPREGPSTLALLLVETDKALALTPPANLPETETAEADKSWFRKQLELFVTIQSSSQGMWSRNLLTTQQMLARGAVADAANLLESTPLNTDPRLDDLRRAVRTYLLQTGRLTHTITTYANTFLVTQ